MHEFKVGEAIMAIRNVAGAPDVKSVIKERLGPLTYKVETDIGFITCRPFEKYRNCCK